MHINFSVDPKSLRETLSAIEFIENSPEIVNGAIDLPQFFSGVSCKTNRFPTSRAGDVVIHLQPSKRLMELMAASRTNKV